jgi:hypothetical protein
MSVNTIENLHEEVVDAVRENMRVWAGEVSGVVAPNTDGCRRAWILGELRRQFTPDLDVSHAWKHVVVASTRDSKVMLVVGLEEVALSELVLVNGTLAMPELLFGSMVGLEGEMLKDKVGSDARKLHELASFCLWPAGMKVYSAKVVMVGRCVAVSDPLRVQPAVLRVEMYEM